MSSRVKTGSGDQSLGMKLVKIVAAFIPFALIFGCSGGGNMGSGGGSGGSSLTLSLASGSAQVFQSEPPVTVDVTLTRTGTTGSVALSVSGLPQGASDMIVSPESGDTGSITISPGSAAVGTYTLTVTASDGTNMGTANLSLTVGAADVISNVATGPFRVAMSTSFQPAEWDYQFFTLNPQGTTTLGNLQPNHIRLQGVSEGVPEGTAGSSTQAWSFSILDAIVQPVLSVGDHSPEFQIAKAPPFMYADDDSSNSFDDLTFAQFAGYAQNLVKYYNTGGFSANGQTYVSPSYPTDTITYWGIYNEPNLNNNLTPQQYVTMYNELVPAMQSVDASLKFVALELSDFSGQVDAWLPPFVNTSTGVTAQVDVMATHFYSSCNQMDTDAQIMSTIPGFVSDVQTFYTDMAANPSLASVPVWVTENNVNADYDAGNGMSACNPGQKFVIDPRGTSPFFAAWRPYVFSQLGKAGIQALYHWDFDADQQFGEVIYATDTIELSYWVDYWLGRSFPATAGSNLLDYTSTDYGDLETLPVINSDGSVVIMISDHAVSSPSDNNGPGVPRAVLVDVSALGKFSSASLLTIDNNTSVPNGPAAVSVTPAPQMVISLDGYSVAFLTLTP